MTNLEAVFLSPFEAYEKSSNTTLYVLREKLPFRQTDDFPLTNSWSQFTGNVIEQRRKQGVFANRNGWEAGVGDGRNAIRAGVHKETGEAVFTGIDVDAWRAALAFYNLTINNARNIRIKTTDAISWFQTHEEPIDGWNMACLPQAPGNETTNHADGIDETQASLQLGRGILLGEQTTDAYGLTLNAAYLRALREKSEQTTDVQVTLSGRIPKPVREALFTQTGWAIQKTYQTAEPIPQDHDTGVAYVAPYAKELDPDCGDGFFEKDRNGLFTPIPPTEAERRRKNRGEVYHHLFVVVAKPKTIYEH